MEPVEAYLNRLEPAARAMIDELRSIVRAVGPDLVETIKWSAPNFAQNGQDRITLGVERRGGVRLVLHLGAKAIAPGSFCFPDPSAIARWPTADRGVIILATIAAIREKESELKGICRDWLQATKAIGQPKAGSA